MSTSIKLVVVGDSTVCDYPRAEALRGWGQLLPEFLVPNVVVVNCAWSGASTRTFLANGWQRALGEKPDYLLIQFGHNDSHESSLPEATDADTEYANNLRHMVREARAAGAVPVLLTPMHRRSFEADGRATQELLPYVTAMKRVAATEQVALIDLHALSGSAIETMGEDVAAHFTIPNDRTHFNEKGARLMANLVAEGGRQVRDLEVLFLDGKNSASRSRKWASRRTIDTRKEPP